MQPQSIKYKHCCQEIGQFGDNASANYETLQVKGDPLTSGLFVTKNRQTSWFCVQRIRQKSREQNMNICLNTVYSARTSLALKESCLDNDGVSGDEVVSVEFWMSARPQSLLPHGGHTSPFVPLRPTYAPLYTPYQCTSYQCATLCTPRYLLHPYTFFWTQVHSRILYHRHYNLDNARN